MTESLVHPDLKHNQNLTKIENHLDKIMENVMAKKEKPQLLQKSKNSTFEQNDFANFIKNGEIGFQKKALSRGNQEGITVPQIIAENLGNTLKRQCPMRQISQSTTIDNERLDILVEEGAAQAGWASETGDREKTDAAKLRTVSIHAHHMYAKPRVSQQLLDDSIIDLESWLSEKLSEQFARTENHAFINGDGNNKPNGFLNYPTIEYGNFNTEQSLQVIKSGEDGNITSTNTLLDIVSSVKSELLDGSCWLMSRSALNMIKRLKDSNDHFIWQLSLSSGTPDTLLGFPVIVSDDMPQATANEVSTPIAFGNFKAGYHIVDRQEMDVLRDPFSAKPYIEFYTTKRVGGDVINFDAIKVLKLENYGA